MAHKISSVLLKFLNLSFLRRQETPVLKPLKSYSIKSCQVEFLEKKLLAELYEIEKKIAGSEEKETILFSLLMRHRTIMQRLRIVRNYSPVPKEPMFFHFYKYNNAEVNRNSLKKSRD